MLNLEKLYYILFLLSLILAIYASKSEEEKRLLDKILNESIYDNSLRPKCDEKDEDKPCIVTVGLSIKSISDIDENKMVYSVQMVVRTNWTDNRLSYRNLLYSNESKVTKQQIPFLLLTNISKIWTPQLYIPSHFNQITTADERVQINEDGVVTHTNVVSLTRSCPMDLKFFPFDTQVCEIIITSYRYTTDDINFEWMQSGAIKIDRRKLILPRFNLSDHKEHQKDMPTLTGTNISALFLTFTFKREYGYYIIQFYIPCALLVMISWLSFWLDEIPTDARLSLVVTNLITLALFIVAINSTLPTSSYIKLIDVYNGTCLLFVIATVFQYTISTLAAFKEERNRQKLLKEDLSNNAHIEMKKFNLENNDAVIIKFTGEKDINKNTKGSERMEGSCIKFRKWRQRFIPQDMPKSKRYDNASKFLFPFLFIIFIIVYCAFLPKS